MLQNRMKQNNPKERGPNTETTTAKKRERHRDSQKTHIKQCTQRQLTTKEQRDKRHQEHKTKQHTGGGYGGGTLVTQQNSRLVDLPADTARTYSL